MSALRTNVAVDVSQSIAPSAPRRTTARATALELCPAPLVSRAGLRALDAFEAIDALASGEPLRIVAIAAGTWRACVLGHVDRAWRRHGLRAAVPPASARVERAAAEMALWLSLGVRASELERVEIAPRPGALVSALVRDDADLGWTEDDPGHAPRAVVPWVSFGGRSGLASPFGPVVLVVGASAGASLVPALASAVEAAARADRAESWREIAGRRGWSVARASSTIGDSPSTALALSTDEGAVASLASYAARLHRLGLVAQPVEVAAAVEPGWLERARRLARSGLGAVA